MTGKLFQPGLMFVGKSRGLPISRVSERWLSRVGSGLISKHLTRLERIARNKHSSFLGKFVNYVRKKFNNIGPWPIRVPDLRPTMARRS